MVAELLAREDWRRPGCDDRCRVVRAIQPGVMGRVEIESHDPDAHEAFGYSMAGTGTIRRYEVQTGPLVVDLSRRTVELEGEALRLSGLEWRFLEYLTRHLNRLCSHEELLAAVWGREWVGANRHVVRMGVTRVRARLGEAHGLIETHSGIGVRLRAIPPCGVADVGGQPSKRVRGWSRDHERCRDCGTTRWPHGSWGLCTSCREKRKRAGISLTDGAS